MRTLPLVGQEMFHAREKKGPKLAAAGRHLREIIPAQEILKKKPASDPERHARGGPVGGHRHRAASNRSGKARPGRHLNQPFRAARPAIPRSNASSRIARLRRPAIHRLLFWNPRNWIQSTKTVLGNAAFVRCFDKSIARRRRPRRSSRFVKRWFGYCLGALIAIGAARPSSLIITASARISTTSALFVPPPIATVILPPSTTI